MTTERSIQERARIIKSHNGEMAARASYSITWGVHNIIPSVVPTYEMSAECYVCGYAHLRKMCPLLRCPVCGEWGHNRSSCKVAPELPRVEVRRAKLVESNSRARGILFSD